MKSSFLFLILIVVVSCTSEPANTPLTEQETPPVENSEPDSIMAVEDLYTLETFQNDTETWGYRILNNGVLFINQPHIPSVQGNEGFSTEEKCEIAGNFVLTKLNQGIIPPTVSYEELDSLGVLNN